MIQRFLFLVMVFSFSSFDVRAGSNDKIYELPVKYIEKHIDGTIGKPRVIMLYASWCPYCRQNMPAMMEIERNKPGSVIAISIDENGADFARYVKQMRDPPFELILNKDSEYKLAHMLKKYGARPWEGIPYYILLDKNNKMVLEGNYDPDYLDSFLVEK